ncbi:hypothetical protein ACFVTF_23395 [Kitasatospora sp. NPDC057940]|uniref:hypothetical protein n=1 Tax=Kitasatospora sp. NPDC057940 TaxID=3346285 RepID=UPI0036D92AA3
MGGSDDCLARLREALADGPRHTCGLVYLARVNLEIAHWLPPSRQPSVSKKLISVIGRSLSAEILIRNQMIGPVLEKRGLCVASVVAPAYVVRTQFRRTPASWTGAIWRPSATNRHAAAQPDGAKPSSRHPAPTGHLEQAA